MPRKSQIARGVLFGRLTAVEPLESRAANGFVRWLCTCECGGWTIATSSNLQHGISKSCGCRRGIHKLSDGDVEAIRNSRESAVALARQYGVSRVHIARIRRGKQRNRRSQ